VKKINSVPAKPSTSLTWKVL